MANPLPYLREPEPLTWPQIADAAQRLGVPAWRSSTGELALPDGTTEQVW